jgi:hypothetical protein
MPSHGRQSVLSIQYISGPPKLDLVNASRRRPGGIGHHCFPKMCPRLSTAAAFHGGGVAISIPLEAFHGSEAVSDR